MTKQSDNTFNPDSLAHRAAMYVYPVALVALVAVLASAPFIF